jgi:CBS domain-containing protein
MAETKSDYPTVAAKPADAKAEKPAEVKPQSFTYNPDPGDPEETVAFGKLVKKGEAVEFTDPNAIAKLKGNTAFMDDAAKKKISEGRAAAADAEAKARAVATEQDLIEAMGESGDDLDTRIPEVPQAGSIETAKKRKLIEQLVIRENERPPEPLPEGGATRRGKKNDE